MHLDETVHVNYSIILEEMTPAKKETANTVKHSRTMWLLDAVVSYNAVIIRIQQGYY